MVFPINQDQIHKVVPLVVYPIQMVLFPTYPMGKVVSHKAYLLLLHKVV